MTQNSIPYSSILISGIDAEKFLQGQLTCDVREVNSKQATVGAMCNSKGRVIANFWLWKHGNDFLMVLPKEMIDSVMAVLRKYGKFSKITLKEIAHLDQHTTPPSLIENIRTGFAVILTTTSEIHTPHDIGLPAIGAVSFTKGCYTGQEIIARMHYRGKLKQHLYHISLNAEKSDLPFTIINIAQVNNSSYEALVVATDDLMTQDLSKYHVHIIKKFE